MRYQVLEAFKVKTSREEMELQPGQIITLPKDTAIKLSNEGKVKSFCYWLKSVVAECQMPCFEIEAKRVLYECPHFKTFWAKRLSELQDNENKVSMETFSKNSKSLSMTETITEEYNQLTTWLNRFDLGKDELKDRLPALYMDIQTSIERLDEAFLIEDLTAFQAAFDDEDIQAFRASQSVKETIYSYREIKELKGVDKDSLRAIHKVKEIFGNSTIEETSLWWFHERFSLRNEI